MSNIGKQPINIPEGVQVIVDDKTSGIIVKGKLGELSQVFNSQIKITINDNDVVVSRESDEKKQRELHGLTRMSVSYTHLTLPTICSV